jgi:hypothetical protein
VHSDNDCLETTIEIYISPIGVTNKKIKLKFWEISDDEKI